MSRPADRGKKFCDVTAPEDKQSECMAIIAKLFDAKDEDQLEDIINNQLHELVDLTGEPLQKIADNLNKYCPVCPDH
jgi:hypothetical protein